MITLLKNLYVETAPIQGKIQSITDEMVHLAIIETNILEQDGATQLSSSTKETAELVG